MELPDVSHLPLSAQIVFVLAAGVVYGLVHFGVIKGKSTPVEKRAGATEIVALTVDSRAIDKLSGEVAGLSVAITSLTVVLTKGGEGAAKQVDDLNEELRQTGRELRELGRSVGQVKS